MIKIIAMGLTPAIWKNVFHHFRTRLPRVHFSAGIFTTPEELAYLEDGYFSGGPADAWPDFLLCGPPPASQAGRQLIFLESLQTPASAVPCTLVLTLPTLEHGLKTLVQGSQPVRLHLDNAATFRLRDPTLVLKQFPADFPRLRVDHAVERIRLRDQPRALSPRQLQEELLLGLGDIAVMEVGEESLTPQEWVRRIFKAEKVKFPPETPLGLIREGSGLFLFPGVPVGRVRGVTLGKVRFDKLIDLGVMTERSPHLVSLTDAIAEAAVHHTRHLEEVTAQLRQAEARRDFPVICEARQPVLAQTLAALLKERGFRRVAEAAPEGPVGSQEPSLVLHLSDPGGGRAITGKRHLILDLSQELTDQLQVLDTLLDWSALTLAPGAVATLTPKTFKSRRERLATRTEKARAGLQLARNRGRLLKQEHGVLQAALARLADLLEARDTVQVWNGELAADVQQVLVFSHDQEEAGAVLQALPRIAKKRWFDLSPFTTADVLQNLNLADVAQYREQGMMVITATSRDRLRKLEGEIQTAMEQAATQAEENQAALDFFQEETRKIEEANRQLAREWVRTTLAHWLDNNGDVLANALEDVRKRNEREWFHRPSTRRIAIISANGQNRRSLLETCRGIFSGFDAENSLQFPYDLEIERILDPELQQPLRTQGEEEGWPADTLRERMAEALAQRNEDNLQRYLEVLEGELEERNVDLFIIEHEQPVAARILERLRRPESPFAETPVICILSDYWMPGPNEPMPWARTRVVILRRLGALSAADCTPTIRALYAV